MTALFCAVILQKCTVLLKFADWMCYCIGLRWDWRLGCSNAPSPNLRSENRVTLLWNRRSWVQTFPWRFTGMSFYRLSVWFSSMGSPVVKLSYIHWQCLLRDWSHEPYGLSSRCLWQVLNPSDSRVVRRASNLSLVGVAFATGRRGVHMPINTAIHTIVRTLREVALLASDELVGRSERLLFFQKMWKCRCYVWMFTWRCITHCVK